MRWLPCFRNAALIGSGFIGMLEATEFDFTEGIRETVAAKQIAATLTITDNSEVGRAIQVLEQVLLDDSQEVSEHDRDLRVIEAERQAELGNVERVQCNYDAAIQHYRSALEIFKRHGHRAGEARVTGCLGLIHRLLSQHEQAIHCHDYKCLCWDL